MGKKLELGSLSLPGASLCNSYLCLRLVGDHSVKVLLECPSIQSPQELKLRHEGPLHSPRPQALSAFGPLPAFLQSCSEVFLPGCIQGPTFMAGDFSLLLFLWLYLAFEESLSYICKPYSEGCAAAVAHGYLVVNKSSHF